MQAFLVRISPKHIDRVTEALASNAIIVGYPEFRDCLDESVTKEDMTRLFRKRWYPDENNNRRAGGKAGNLWRFLREMQIGDLVIVPRKRDIYFGRVQGPPFYLQEFADDYMAYRRKVNWLNKDRPVARHSLPESLQKEAKRRETCSDITASLDDIVSFLESVGMAWNDYERLAEEVMEADRYVEGATRQIAVNSYERNSAARRACIDHYGLNCAVCGFSFAEFYGETGEDFIHVHHLKDLATIGEEYQVDPIEDLRPVCPNCHAMLHRTVPAMSIDCLRAVLQERAEAKARPRSAMK